MTQRKLVARRMLIAQLADVATFALFIWLAGTSSIRYERDPLIAIPFALGGLTVIFAMKAGLAFVVARRAPAPARITASWYWPVWTIMISAAAASGIAGAGFNLAAIVRWIQ